MTHIIKQFQVSENPGCNDWLDFSSLHKVQDNSLFEEICSWLVYSCIKLSAFIIWWNVFGRDFWNNSFIAVFKEKKNSSASVVFPRLTFNVFQQQLDIWEQSVWRWLERDSSVLRHHSGWLKKSLGRGDLSERRGFPALRTWAAG